MNPTEAAPDRAARARAISLEHYRCYIAALERELARLDDRVDRLDLGSQEHDDVCWLRIAIRDSIAEQQRLMAIVELLPAPVPGSIEPRAAGWHP